MKYLDLTGLGEVWANIKSYISSKIPTKTSQLQNDSNYAKTSQLPSKTSQLTNDSGFLTSTDISNKADKATTLSGYGITDAYTKTQVDKKVSDLVNSAPKTLDTLNELASALGNDPNFATTVANQIGTKANNSDVVHKSGKEAINGLKVFNDGANFSYTRYIVQSGYDLTEAYSRTIESNYSNVVADVNTFARFDFSMDHFSAFRGDGFNSVNLGTPSNKWKDVYATTFHGDIDFPITEAQVNEILGIA